MPSLGQLPSKSRVNRAGTRLAGWLGGQVELSPRELVEEGRVVLDWRAQHAYPMALVMPGLRNWVARYSTADITPAQRLKRMIQIVTKLQRHPGMKLARMQDVGGCRAVLSNAREVEQVHRRIEANWTVVHTADYRDGPRTDTGYRALHVMVAKRDRISDEDRTVEIQLRTLDEHRWAETVMATGNRHGYALRDGEGPPELVEYFRMASDVLWLKGRGQRADSAFVERFEDLREQVRPYFMREG